MKSTRSWIFLIVLLLAAMAIVPMASADEEEFTLNITFPKEGGNIYGDTIGFPVSIYADVNSPKGIKEVRITNGINQSLCRTVAGQGFLCQNPWQTGRNTITITAYDNLGKVVSQTRNYTLIIGQHPPLMWTSIVIFGKVTDTNGRAISNVTVELELVSPRQEGGSNKKRFLTGENGSYSIQETIVGEDFVRNISVTKEGYFPIQKKITLLYENQTREQNFILTPQNQDLSGFNEPLGICSILISLLIFKVRKR